MKLILLAFAIGVLAVTAEVGPMFWGKRCDNTVNCPAGQQAIKPWRSNNATCTSCPYDTFKPAAGTDCCKSCGYGTTNRTTGATTCLCPPGSYRLSTGDCKRCSMTSYSTTWDAAACDACPSGSVSSRWGTSCICPPGTQAIPGSGPGVAGCTNCTGNTANPWPTNATDACKTCPATSISLDGVLCVCPAGNYAQFGSAKASAASTTVPAHMGWWWDVELNFTCTPCPNNTIQPFDMLVPMCKPCALDRTSSIANTAHTQCVCETGYYATGRGKGSRPRHSWPACVQCSNGTTTPGQGLYTSCNITA